MDEAELHEQALAAIDHHKRFAASIHAAAVRRLSSEPQSEDWHRHNADVDSAIDELLAHEFTTPKSALQALASHEAQHAVGIGRQSGLDAVLIADSLERAIIEQQAAQS
ncbi:hypothetical protein C5E10_09010 [Pseudoclavibacter sp. RFBG4]|uniref:hypothetical protein n=1 Tax=Pseudoclavibacter sp. RFBG4 TaxID=2080575 RepID=UPI000CE74CC7|nr:hypothetical protein [Pseudoclavibacter sp. RFBG4]PPG33926.1 hypothetical protein C5E10_09010 [Pseudoclavibacter sp. RFBG4]